MTARRSFLARFSGIAAGLGIAAVDARAQDAQPGTASPQARWQPARDAKDDWFDQIPGKHRLLFDTLTDAGLHEARGFANNYFDASKSGYGLEQTDLAVVVCLRHFATPFAFTDVFWAKYGPIVAESLKLADPTLTTNPHKTPLEALGKRGVHYAVCDMASHRYAGLIARKADTDAETVYKDMAAHLVGNAHFVAAGIIAVN